MTQWPTNMRIRPVQLWPGGLTAERKRSNFKASWSQTLDLLDRELWFLKATNVVLQVAMEERDFRIDGFPRATAKAKHPGVILSLDSIHGPLSWPCDTFDRWQDNVRAIALAMEALRKVDRYGVTKRGEQYTGWKQLPGGMTDESPMDRDEAIEALRFHSGSDNGPLDVERAFRIARRMTHPDHNGGSRDDWNEVEEAAKVLGLL